jgi:hypothetical protein
MEFDVELDPQHLQRLTAAAPLTGIVELIWNGLDADADEVKVEFARNEFDGITEIRVVDDGHGMTVAEAAEAFKKLGGSWKANAPGSRQKNRALHGRDGKGRFRAAGIGNRMRWKTIAADPQDGDRHKLTWVTLDTTNLRHVDISEPEETDESTGTTVFVDAMSKPPRGLGGEAPVQKLTAEFGLGLQNHNAHLIYDREVVDPAADQSNRADYPIAVGGSDDALLTVVEWKRTVHRALYLCDEQGTPLAEQTAGIHAVGFNFTAYVSWTGFTKDNDLEVADLSHGDSKAVLELARDQLREHFSQRSGEKTREQIDEWKDQNVYPFREDPSTPAEEAIRDVFDVVALTASSVVNKSDRSGRRFSLGLLKEALEADPGSLHHVLQEVLDLSSDQIEYLSQLLDRTPLQGLISTTKAISNRLEFLRGLEELVLTPDVSKHVKERSQLHRILANETWVFGEEFALAVDDESLTKVLKAHIDALGRSELAPEEVRDAEGHRRIVDLMLARSLKQNRNKREHLVIELKAPSVPIGDEELLQINRYATAVATDPRFNTVDVKWDFYVVSTRVTGTALLQQESDGRPYGLVTNAKGVRVWVLTWAEIIEAADHRLKFVKEHLGYQPDEKRALEYLRKTHAKFLPPEIADDGPPGNRS